MIELEIDINEVAVGVDEVERVNGMTAMKTTLAFIDKWAPADQAERQRFIRDLAAVISATGSEIVSAATGEVKA